MYILSGFPACLLLTRSHHQVSSAGRHQGNASGVARYSISRGALRGRTASTPLPECFALLDTDSGPKMVFPELQLLLGTASKDLD
ncbi:hypothetical protein ATANTOWER_013109 [Ataeniobius toweri]|uniref:Secreted protein n=1 Tax=Ataeniobius toweri TaxID=208326 RepID=A0ABU7BPY7_9TELE|nr:hypothetical protein [Ataeniobius toweri]